MFGNCPQCGSKDTVLLADTNESLDYRCDNCECEFTEVYEVEYTYLETVVNLDGCKVESGDDNA